MQDHFLLNTNQKMPVVGLGTWKARSGEVGRAVEYALTEAGYNHIDCAAIYLNEQEIGGVFKKVFNGTRKRDDVFVTSKLWNTDHHKEDVRKACEQTLKDLNLEYLNLYLMHWGVSIPANWKGVLNHLGRLSEKLDENGVLITDNVPIRETWEAMEELVSAGLVKSIGVANFTKAMLEDLLSYAKIKPAVNQVEMHPYLQQKELLEFCKIENIVVTAYSPLGSPGNYKDKGVFLREDKTIAEIAGKHKKSWAQVVLRWGVQRGTVVIPKSVSLERLKENISIIDFELSESEMKQMEGLDRNMRFVEPLDWWGFPYFD